MVTASVEADRTEGKTTANFRELQFFAADGFRLGGQRRGGYAIDVVAATTEGGEEGHEEEDEEHAGLRPFHAEEEEEGHHGGAGSLEYAYVSLPFAGRRGQLALTAGQLNPMDFQYSPHNAFIHEAQPSALAAEIDGFSFAESVPGLRVDFFDRRSTGTADGNYLMIGVPFEGKLALNRDANLGAEHGVFANAFHRVRWNTLGVFGYTHTDNYLVGTMGTYQPLTGLYLLGVAALGRDEAGDTRRLTMESEYVVDPRLALTGRLEFLGGVHDDVAPVAAVTWYPFQLPVLRLTAEAVQRKGERGYALTARGQF
jgi:hypothetical protein